MILTDQNQINPKLSQQSQKFIKRMVDKFLLMKPSEQQAHLTWVKERFQFFNSQKKSLEMSKSTQGTTSPQSQDRSPMHIKKTISLMTSQKVNDFKTQPEIQPRACSQQEIKEIENKKSSKLDITNLSFNSQQYDLSTQEINELDLYPMPKKITDPQQQRAFYYKVIKPLMFLGMSASSYNKAIQSRASMKTLKNNFKEVKNLGLFYMDLVTSQGRGQTIGPAYLNKLQKLNKLLMFKIEIGMHCECIDLKKIFNTHWQNLVQIILQRIWTKDSEDSEEEHGLNFFTCKQNLKNIKKIMLLGNYLTKKFYESLKDIQLPQLQVLEMNFQKQVDHEELLRIFEVISTYNNTFEIHLVTKKRDKNEFPQYLTKKYGERIYLIDKNKKPCEKLQNQRPIQKKEYKKKAYQIAHENNQKIGSKTPYVPKNGNVSIINPNLPLVNTAQQVPQASNMNTSPVQQVSGVNNHLQLSNQPLFGQRQNFNNIGININGKSGNIKIGSSEVNQKTQLHHHTQIVHQHHHHKTQNHYSMTDSESRQRSFRNNYYNNRGESRSQYGNRYQYEQQEDDSSDDDDGPYWQNGYSYRGYNNQKYKKRYNNNYGGYYKKWYQDD